MLAAGIADAIRYLQPGNVNKIAVTQARPANRINELVFVYNANGGIYPGIADFIHKEIFPSSYPCNLCYQTFGTFGMKKEWKSYLDSLQHQKTFLHKDQYKRKYEPSGLQLPAILASNGKQTWILVSAAEINTARSLTEMIGLLNQKLTP